MYRTHTQLSLEVQTSTSLNLRCHPTKPDTRSSTTKVQTRLCAIHFTTIGADLLCRTSQCRVSKNSEETIDEDLTVS